MRRLRLVTNNPGKYLALKGFPPELAERERIEVPAGPDNRGYLATKKSKMGHLLDSV